MAGWFVVDSELKAVEADEAWEEVREPELERGPGLVKESELDTIVTIVSVKDVNVVVGWVTVVIGTALVNTVCARLENDGFPFENGIV